MPVADCHTEFVEAMRARLIADDPASGPNVDRPDVRPNLEALGTAVFRILDVHTASTVAADPTFWAWVASVNAWLNGLSAWQQGVSAAFAAWAPATASETALQTAIAAVAAPGPPPPPGGQPTSLRVTVP